uniref:Uncharacterized protein LOC102803817 n=1 Tax=Saccoglossus kowalevskii TaxID=10224 RepID=A0ABM0MKP7_SACKO
MMLGASGAGKSSTVKSILGEPFKEELDSTDGMKTFHIRSDLFGKFEVVEDTEKDGFCFKLFDIGVHEIYQIFMAPMGIYILVVDLSLNLDDIVVCYGKKKTMREYIHGCMNLVHSHTTKVGQDLGSIIQNVIVVGTKIDLISKLSRVYMSDWSFWESSGEDCQPVITKLDVKSGCVYIEWDLGKATSGFIERSDDKLKWIEIKTVKAKTGSYKDAGLQPQTTYYYRIQVEDDTSAGYTVSINTEGDIDSSKNEGVSCEDKFNQMLIEVSSDMGE